jgi:hypothetical protein
MTGADFLRVRQLYGDTQVQFGRRIGFVIESDDAVGRKVRRYESRGPIVGPMAVLLELLEAAHGKPDTRRRSKSTSPEERRLQKIRGGQARAAKLTPERRSEIARAAANARWK